MPKRRWPQLNESSVRGTAGAQALTEQDRRDVHVDVDEGGAQELPSAGKKKAPPIPRCRGGA